MVKNDKSMNRVRVMLSILKVLSGVNPECRINFYPEGLNITSIDENARCIVIAQISRRFFAHWRIQDTYSLKTDINSLKRIFSHKVLISRIRQRAGHVIEVSFANPSDMSLLLNVVKTKQVSCHRPTLTRSTKLLSLKLSSKDIITFLKMASFTFDDLCISLDSKGTMRLYAKFLDYMIVKRINRFKIKEENLPIAFSIPMRYATLLLHLLNLVDEFRLALTKDGSCIFTIGKRGLYLVKLIISSRIERLSGNELY